MNTFFRIMDATSNTEVIKCVTIDDAKAFLLEMNNPSYYIAVSPSCHLYLKHIQRA